MKIAVTGASGFIGRHVVRALSEDGNHELIATSRSACEVPPGVKHVALDVSNADRDGYDRLGRPDVLIHLAWNGLPNYFSLHHFETELPGQYRFLKGMIEAGLPKLLVTGTCYEYGMVSGELDEAMPARPANPYAFAKAALHRQLEFLRSEIAFELTWARLFYMWGDGQASGSIYPLLQAAVARGDSSFPMSRGEQLRDYLPIAEVARHLIALALNGAGHDVVNVCSGQPTSIRSLVERWIAENGCSIVPELGRYPYPTYEPLAFWGNRKRLDARLVGPDCSHSDDFSHREAT